jgi:hypothetical protein
MARRITALLSLFLMILAIPSLAADPATSPSATQPSDTLVVDGDVHANAAANAILQRRTPEIRFNANSFSDVVDFLRDVTSANIFVDWASLEAAGVSKDAPVTTRLHDVKFSTALNLILQSVSVNAEAVYFVEGGVIQITTADRAAHRVVVQTYDVSALASAEQVDRLRQMIVDNIDAPSWRENGGRIGAISVFKDKLVVAHNALTQQKVSALLQSLGDHTVAAGDPNSAQPHPATKPAKMQP